MKARQTAVLWLILVVLISMAGIPSAASGSPPAPAYVERTLTQVDSGGLVELGRNELLTVRLEGNPSTGYGWYVGQVDGGVLRPVAEWDFVPHSDLPGAPGTQTLRFAGVDRGLTDLELVYRRPWEKNVAPAGTFSVRVRSQGSFTGSYGAASAAAPDLAAGAEQPAVASELPASYNWCDLGGCTPVKNQGSCGSCWAFSTVGPLEANILIKDGVTRNISEQYLVSCNTDGWGCDGGWFGHDYHEWKIPPGEPEAGAVWEADFPYTASDSPCNPPHAHHEKLADWVTLASGVPPVNDVKQAIYDHGPVSAVVCVDGAFQSYNSGLYSGPGCSSTNHAIVLVGWDDSLGTNGAWRLRNSWGTGWGEAGYMWIEYGVSIVGYRANYVVYNSGGNQSPVASFTYDCSSLHCDFDASESYDPDGSLVSYDWDFGDGSTASGVTASHYYAAAGTHTVVLTVTDDQAATATDSQSVTVTEQQGAIHIGDLDGSGAPSNKKFWRATVAITVHDANDEVVPNVAVSGTWSGGSSGSSSCLTGAGGQCAVQSPQTLQTNPSLTFEVDGASHPALPYEPASNDDPDGDSDGTSITVTLGGGGNQPPEASFIYDCTGLQCTFDASGSSDPDGTIVDYAWDFGGGNTATGVSAAHTFPAAGTYPVELTVTDNDGATDAETQNVPVGGQPGVIYVSDIAMSGKAAGPNRSATAEVAILDTSGSPVAGATVSGTWSGNYSSSASGVTGAAGTVSFTSGKVRQANAEFTFTVDLVAKSGYEYDHALNVISSAHITVP